MSNSSFLSLPPGPRFGPGRAIGAFRVFRCKTGGGGFRIAAGDIPVELIVHRTSRSFEQPVGEYRARVVAAIEPEFAEFLRGKEEHLNRFATLGALTTSNKDVSVICQCLMVFAKTYDEVAGTGISK